MPTYLKSIGVALPTSVGDPEIFFVLRGAGWR
jgi:hypothetical protein